MNRRARGFTLLEMVIAIGIFAVISMVSYGSLRSFLASSEVLAQRETRLRALQSTLGQLARDLRFAARRPVRDEYGDVEAALMSRPADPPAPGEWLRLTAAAPDPQLPEGSRLTRVAWRLEDGKLYRVYWKVLDRATDSPQIRRLMLERVSGVTLRFLSYDPEEGLTGAGDWEGGEGLPAGVEIVLIQDDTRRYRRVFEVGDGA